MSAGMARMGSAMSNGREPKSCLGQVFNYKLGRIAMLFDKCMAWHAATSRVKNSAQVSSCQLKFVYGQKNTQQWSTWKVLHKGRL
jgi:hypothetical protein